VGQERGLWRDGPCGREVYAGKKFFALGWHRVYKDAQPGGQNKNPRIDNPKQTCRRLNLRADFWAASKGEEQDGGI
jgi:hypothetical protein